MSKLSWTSFYICRTAHGANKSLRWVLTGIIWLVQPGHVVCNQRPSLLFYSFIFGCPWRHILGPGCLQSTDDKTIVKVKQQIRGAIFIVLRSSRIKKEAGNKEKLNDIERCACFFSYFPVKNDVRHRYKKKKIFSMARWRVLVRWEENRVNTAHLYIYLEN